jgi:uncharacterized protein with HEPN domain
MPRSVHARLDDILDAISGIQSTLSGVSFEAFSGSWQLQRAVERGLEIVSEASRSIPDSLKATEPTIPWRDIASIGNLLRHEYQRAEPVIVWNIADRHLDLLDSAVRNMIQRTADDS